MTTPPPVLPLSGRCIGVSYESRSNLFCRDLTDGVQEAAAARGITVIARDCAQSAQRQLTDVADLLDHGVDALVISAQDPAALGPALAAAQARGVPVITVDRAADGPVLSHITSDNRLGGQLAASLLGAELGGRGEVAIVGLPSATSVGERVEGFAAAIAGQAGLRIVAEVSGESNRQRVRAVTADLLHMYERLAGIFAVNDVTVQGVLLALEDAGRTRDVVVVGYDATPQGCAEILRGGPLRGEVAQFPAQIGQTAVEVWAGYLQGMAVPARIEIPVELVTRENVERFTGAERLLRMRRGEVAVAGERVVLFPVRGYQLLLNEIHAASPSLLRHIVYHSGFELGQRIAAQVGELYPDLHDRLVVLLEDLTRGGFGTFELLNLDLAAGSAEVRGHDLFEAACAPDLAWARTPRCVDLYCSGRLAGYLTAMVGLPTACEEVACQARGDPECRFVLTVEAG